ncbi:polyadenylate-binding protein 2 isoform X1 [Tribolium castaneum]|uniref:Polyadenylate-binding protein 2-like Protein n=1 Tax=Tribolium castaneum TaxID=7070 RepID=D6WR37_TRICA|nr:PREDICTED: polyadenylate-binding protein 2 isoform X1 [Tribolium castaneum]EFA07014.1 Polyadenylate-binding protein 2-like Protein [Tribolium castaneum]|eukprot:XP_008195901.1 PREDICTED: polyadenylate-binding protein 2 isoform X1 [Tribolium castaneum]
MADNEDLGLGPEDHLESLDETNGMHDDALLNDTDLDGTGGDDPELEAIKARVREMEEEAEKLKQLQSEVDKQMNMGSPPGLTSPLNMSLEEKMEVDNRSIYVGNVDYGATAEELEQHFHGCGSINRVTILCNKYDGHPKGFAYIEFGDRDSVQTAMAMDESLFRGRPIKVMPKRTNRPGLSTTNRPPRGRGAFRGARGVGRGFYAGYRPMRRPRSYRRGGYFSPY